jgi:hypothetical protein
VNRVRLLRRLAGAGAAAALLVAGHASISSASSSGGIDQLRKVTDQYHNLGVAQRHGYAVLADVNGITCIADDQPAMQMAGHSATDMKMQMQMGSGAMGVHYANGKLVGAPVVNADKPEALLYAPDDNGGLHLAGVEYVVVKAAWDAKHANPPALFGHQFNFTDAPNRFGLPPFYSLHVWAWKTNPAGTFAMFNPNVHCPAA